MTYKSSLNRYLVKFTILIEIFRKITLFCQSFFKILNPLSEETGGIAIFILLFYPLLILFPPLGSA
jgi:hypothetical protein